MTKDLEYYTRREGQHRALAAATNDVTARRLHIEMARLYAKKLEEIAPPMSIRAA